MTQNTAPMQVPQSSAAYADLSARVQALEDALAARDERTLNDRTRLSTLEQSYNTASWSFDNGRPVFSSGDGRFTMAIRTRFQSDFADFQQSKSHPAGFAGPADLSSGAVVRRAYFGVEGRAYTDFAYEFRINLGGTNGSLNTTCTTGCAIGGIPSAGEGDPILNKAVLTYIGIPNWHFNIGVLQPVMMFEGTMSSASLIFLERPEIDNIAFDSFGGNNARRGMELSFARQDTLWPGDNLAVTASLTGNRAGSAATHGNGGDENVQVIGRISERLWGNGVSNIQVGTTGSRILYSGNSAGGGSQSINLQERPQVRIDGTRLISTGSIAAKTGTLWAADMGGNIENIFVGGEYAHFTLDRQCGALSSTLVTRCTSSTAVVDHPSFDGWYLEAAWTLTGESRVYSPTALNSEVGGFNAPVPSRPFSLAGGSWGAWELAARYSNTNLNWNSSQLATPTQLAGILGGEERVLALALNWYLNRNVRVMLDDNIVSVKKGTAALPNRDSQDFNVLGVRFQFAT